jgi:hypothetical protein
MLNCCVPDMISFLFFVIFLSYLYKKEKLVEMNFTTLGSTVAWSQLLSSTAIFSSLNLIYFSSKEAKLRTLVTFLGGSWMKGLTSSFSHLQRLKYP